MPRARKKPVEIEFEIWDGTEATAAKIDRWINENGTKAMALFPDADGPDAAEKPMIAIDTLEGVITASPGDYVIRGVAGEFYPCKPDIFLATYDVVEYPEESQSIGDHHG